MYSHPQKIITLLGNAKPLETMEFLQRFLDNIWYIWQILFPPFLPICCP